MAMNDPFDARSFDRRLFLAVAVLFPIAVLIGFAPTYYLKFAFANAPLPSLLVHLHGALMTTWIVLFITQVFLISKKKVKLHQRLGIFGVILAPLLVFVGCMTGIASAARGAGVPGISPLSFLMVPLGDMVVFAILFGAAIHYRRQSANHKRLIFLTVLNFLPPALGRFPFEFAGTPPFFFGVPDVIAIGFLIFDTWKTGKLNKVYLAGVVLLIVSHVIRLTLSGTETWLRFAAWLTSWAA
jgi:hypothetical protein